MNPDLKTRRKLISRRELFFVAVTGSIIAIPTAYLGFTLKERHNLHHNPVPIELGNYDLNDNGILEGEELRNVLTAYPMPELLIRYDSNSNVKWDTNELENLSRDLTLKPSRNYDNGAEFFPIINWPVFNGTPNTGF